MATQTTKWKDRGFDDKQHYAGWLHFNDLADDCKMHDDVYHDPYTGQVINITDAPKDGDLEFDDEDFPSEEDE
ncbi:hypothetical protein Hena1_00510 [Erwinia phage Hena1]|uniref:Uncharacterized protein n=1 Tax=Erwinia phage Hena1 TaxID=2678601 RepID=A0A6B9JI62_9CAUD|nr:hypothetical protein HWC84_gp050 [Erwinia phage Hena1]QGZ16227.1 hypothetical protein Hena1_00510 [Erwinia phage Hena1]